MVGTKCYACVKKEFAALPNTRVPTNNFTMCKNVKTMSVSLDNELATYEQFWANNKAILYNRIPDVYN